MAAKPITVEQCREALDVLARCGNMIHSEEAGIVEFRGEEFKV